MIEKSPKDLADGKCSYTSPLPPTVGIAFARSIFFILSTDGKYAKILSDGKCHRTGPNAPTVGMAPARIIMAN